MHERLQRALVKRVLAHLEQRTTDSAAEPATLEIGAYADAERMAREDARLFRELPVAIGHVSQLREPGDFFTHDASGVPVIAVRGDDGAIGAYVNVCRHRGTRVEPAACGHRKTFVCPYHAWSYGRDGRLLGIPHERGFATVDRAQRGLVRVPVGVAAGLVFVKLAPGDTSAIDPSAWLGPIVNDLVGFGTATSSVYAPQVQTRPLSWKLAIDIFLEAYHLRSTHGDSIYGMFFDNLSLVDTIGSHLRNIFPKRSIRDLAALPEETWELRRHANVLYQVFPNTLVLVEPDHAAVLHLWPNGPSSTILTSYTLVPEAPATDKARAYWDANNAILYNAIAEDFAMGESIQRGLASGANRNVVFGAFEHALAHFHRQIAEHTRI